MGSCAYPSANPQEWLTDVHLANAHANDQQLIGVTPVRYNYPRPLWLMAKIFEERSALRVLQEQEQVLVQQFCDGCHWHNLVLIGPERIAYYWEPLGTALSARSPVRTAFFKAAPAGWTLQSIRFKLQAYGHSCGDWSHYFRCRVLAYVARDSFELDGHEGEFPAFLLGEEMHDLTLLTGSARTEAERQQRRIARRLRDKLRELLRFCANMEVLEYGETLLTDFTADGQLTSTRTIIDCDQALPGDSEFHSIYTG